MEKFLCDALTTVQNEPTTSTWFALRLGPSTYGIFDTFADGEGRQAHLSGKIAEAIQERSAELFSQPPATEQADVLAMKLPEVVQY